MNPNGQDRLLIECLRAEGDSMCDHELNRLTHSDWENVVRQSDAHNIAPFLYQCLKRCGSTDHIPAGVLQFLREAYFRNTAANTRRLHDLSKVLELLRKAGIPVIVMKGAHLAFVKKSLPTL